MSKYGRNLIFVYPVRASEYTGLLNSSQDALVHDQFVEGVQGAVFRKEKGASVILPAVLYHGTQKWNESLYFAGMIEGRKELKAYIPQFSYDLYNLHVYKDERILLGSVMTPGVVLYLMKQFFDDYFRNWSAGAAEYFRKISGERKQFEFLEWMLRYTSHAGMTTEIRLNGA